MPLCRALALFWLAAVQSPVHAQDVRTAPSPERPVNVLLITADDLGFQMGAYGDAVARTPHLDRLAREGMRFSRAYVTQASCSPSRSSMLTGLYPHQNGQVGLSHRGYRMHHPFPNIPFLLKEAGYRTGIIGKLHVQPEEAFPFDYKHTDARATRDVREVARQAEAFMEDAGDAPFFLMVNYFDPHAEFIPQVEGLPEDPHTPDEVEPFAFNGIRTAEMRETIADFYSCVSRMDAGIGLLLEQLAEAGHADDTLVLFVSDNGPPFARAKVTSYEAGVRVPFLVRWPGQVREAAVSDALVSTVDLLPTVMEAAGLPVPETTEGRSLLPLFEAGEVTWRDGLVTEYTSHTKHGYYPQRTIRDRQHKLIVTLLSDRPRPGGGTVRPATDFTGKAWKEAYDRMRHPPPIELYDLVQDPLELQNLAGDPGYRDVRDRLLAALQAWRTRTGDPLLGASPDPVVNPSH